MHLHFVESNIPLFKIREKRGLFCRLVLCLMLYGILAPPSEALGQSMQDVFKPLLLRTETKSASTEPPATEQILWVQQQLALAEEQLVQVEAEKNQGLFLKAGLPADAQKSLQAATKEWIQNCEFALDTLNAVVEEEKRPTASTVEPSPSPEVDPLELRKQRSLLNKRLENLQATQALSDETLLRYRQEEKEWQTRVNEIATQAADSVTPNETFLFNQQLAQTKLAVAGMSAFNYAWRSYLLTLQSQKLEVQLKSVENQLKAQSLDASITSDLATRQLKDIELEQAEVEQQIRQLRQDITTHQSKLQQTRDNLPSGAPKGSDSTGAPPTQAEQENEVAELEVETTEQLIHIYEIYLQALSTQQSHWESVKSVSSTQTYEELQRALEQTQSPLALIERWRPQLEQRLKNDQEELDLLNDKIKNWRESDGSKKLAERRLGIFQKRTESLRRLTSEISELETILKDWKFSLEQRIAEVSLAAKTAKAASDFQAQLSAIWNYQLFTVADSSVPGGNRSITLSKLIIALIGLVLAFYLAHLLARRFAGYLSRRFSITESQSDFAAKWTFYLLGIIFVLTTLQWLRIPLTVFAFLGGALVIGLGFGAQNLINNFISGLILMLERRIKVGDLVEVDGFVGKIVNLGSRCSLLRKFDGVEVLVPNSNLLEKSVVNWTLSDPKHRYEIKIGVGYDSDPKLVLRLLENATIEHVDVLRDPAPVVVFEDFGDSALVFRIYYWLIVGSAVDARKVATELRVRIMELCQEHQISIPYPQSDMHLSQLPPIKVTLDRPPAS